MSSRLLVMVGALFVSAACLVPLTRAARERRLLPPATASAVSASIDALLADGTRPARHAQVLPDGKSRVPAVTGRNP